MLFYIIAGAVAIDAFASGIWVGHKWGAASMQSALQTAGADAAKVEAKLESAAHAAAPAVLDIEAAIKAEVAKLMPKATYAPNPPGPNPNATVVVAPVDPAALATAQALIAQAANAPK